MPPDKLPEELPWKWRQVATPITLSAAAFAQLVLEENLDTKKAGGYEWAARKTQDGHDLYRTLDAFNDAFNWDSIPYTTKTGADPPIEVAPGEAAYRITIAAGKRFRPEIAKVTLVASADVANRQFYFFITDGADYLFSSVLGLVITAGQTKVQTWMRMSMNTTAGLQYGIHFPDLELQPGWQMGVYCLNFDTVAAGDNASALVVYGKEAPA